MLSDGSATYNLFNEEYKGTNPQSAHNNLVKDWNSAKDYAYKNGKAKDGWSRHKHMSSFYAVVTSEATAYDPKKMLTDIKRQEKQEALAA